MSTFYDILGIPSNASKEQIKTAYRKLSIKFHPDKNDGDAYFSQMFQQINEAYTILFDEEERRKYDLNLSEQSELKKHSERLKKLEEELAYKNQLLKEKRNSFVNNPISNIEKTSKKTEKAFSLKIKHVKYFLWVIIIGFIIAIGMKSNRLKKSTPKVLTYSKKSKKTKHKSKQPINNIKPNEEQVVVTSSENVDSLPTSDVPAVVQFPTDTSDKRPK
ncbi:J domain-containing protein [Pedobacter frigiditerrae]|uniref:J domain-containing protein n=1 Tax=Pedobacter frigiditerrae TaxID=2530452 RepID=UPI00292CF022|nr:J domain-containing protein [Pedobacter frigiditerrae]